MALTGEKGVPSDPSRLRHSPGQAMALSGRESYQNQVFAMKTVLAKLALQKLSFEMNMKASPGRSPPSPH